ncbi:MAG: N-acetylmuramoyl-L-alanine amidase [Bryobacteraceae bacterium]|jgi:N-acetylmuramoyl-L-alanine amidase
MKRLLACAVSVPLLLAQAGRGPSVSVTAVRHSSFSGTTRVAIEVSGAFEFRYDRLHNPERVYYDILNAEPRFGSKRSYTETPDDRLIERIRAAETAPAVTRVVLYLTGPAEVSASKLASPNRLIIEVRAAAPPAPPTATASAAPKSAPAPPPVDVPKAAKRTSAGESSLTRTLGLKIERVVIDPGHGGHDQGTEGPHGLLEKDLVLDVAQRLGALIEDHMDAEVVYTRTGDTFVPLERRTALANEKKADLFLSIHANSSPVAGVAGIETFYLSINGTKYANDVAARENASLQKSVFELADLIQTIARQDKAEESREFAERVQAALYAFSARNVPGAKNRGVKPAPFVVLIGAHMPSVLAEIGFLSNPREEALLKTPDYRQKLADAIFHGVSRYADSLSHFQAEQTPAAKSLTPTPGHSPE